MLLRVLGKELLTELKRSLDSGKQTRLKAVLDILTIRRNDLAHTYTKGTTPIRDAPSVNLERLDAVFKGLRDYQKCVKALVI